MDLAALLPAKKLVSAQLTKITTSINTSGGPGYFRFKASITSADFKFLFEKTQKATNPRCDFSGDAASGLIIVVSEHGKQTVVQQSAATVVCGVNVRDIHATENKVATHPTRAILAEYEDGSRYMLLEPLPDDFLSTKTREKLEGHREPLHAVFDAFEKVGIKLPPINKTPPLLSLGKPLPIKQPPSVIATGKAETVPLPLATGSVKTDDVREALEMLNEQVKMLREHGANVELRIVDGRVRARVEVIIQQEL